MNEQISAEQTKSPFQQVTKGLNNEIDLRKLALDLWHDKWLILMAAAIAALIGFYVSLRAVPSYQTSALLQISQGGDETLAMNSIANMLMGAGLGGRHSQQDTISAIMKSRYVLEEVASKLHLNIEVLPVYFPVVGKVYAHKYKGAGVALPKFGLSKYAWGGESLQVTRLDLNNFPDNRFILQAGTSGTYKLLDADHHKLLDGQVGKLAVYKRPNQSIAIFVKELRANAQTQFRIVKIPNEEIVERIAKNVTITPVSTSGDNGGRAVSTGILQVTYTDHSSKEAVSVLNHIVDVTYTLEMKQKAEEAARTIHFLDKQLPQQKHKLNAAEASLANYQQKSGNLDMTTETGIALQQLTEYNKEEEQLRLQRVDLLERYMPTHPYVLAIDDKIKEVQQKINSLKSKMRHMPVAGLKTASLLRDVKSSDFMYQNLIAKAQEVQVLAAGLTSDMKILDYAYAPPTIIPVKTVLMIAVGTLVGLLLGAVFIVLRGLLSDRVTDPEVVEQQFGIPTQAIVPYSKRQAELNALVTKKTGEQVDLKSRVLARLNAHDMSIEALRGVRTSLQLRLLDAKNNVISIVGLTPGIGKSFVSLNFAHVLADVDQRVLLVDADLRKGVLHKGLQRPSSPGLSDFLLGRAELEEITQCIEKDRLYFIGKGRHIKNTGEAFLTPRCKEFFELVKKQYDIVVVDTAPVLVLSDGIEVASYAATNFLVLASGIHNLKEIRIGLNSLHNRGVEVYGTIMNFRQQRQSDYYYSYYYNGYAYKYYDAYANKGKN